MDFFHLLLIAGTLICMLIGLVGVVVPRMAGLHLVWFAVFFYAVATYFRQISYVFLGYTAGLVLFTDVLEFLRSKQQQRNFRVTPAGVAGGLLGAFAGFAIGWIPAMVIGAVFGAVVVEVAFGRDVTYRVETEAYTFIGSLGMTLIRLAVGVSLIILWLAQVFRPGLAGE